MRVHNSYRRLATVALAMCLAASTALGASTIRITSGVARLAFSEELIAAFRLMDATLTSVAPGRVEGGSLILPISGGVITRPGAIGEINTSGGFRISTKTTTIELSSFTIVNDGTNATVTALVTINGTLLGRAAVFNIVAPEGIKPIRNEAGELEISNLRLTLTQRAADFLNQSSGTTSFTAGSDSGSARISFRATRTTSTTPK